MLTSDKMNEQECEVLWVSKGLFKKKISLSEYRVRVLEKESKYQHEQQHNLIDTKVGPDFVVPSTKSTAESYPTPTLSALPSLSNQPSKGKRSKKISLEKKKSSVKSSQKIKCVPTTINYCEILKENYLINSEKKRNALSLKNDFEVGITEYVSLKQGFTAVVEHCNSYSQKDGPQRRQTSKSQIQKNEGSTDPLKKLKKKLSSLSKDFCFSSHVLRPVLHHYRALQLSNMDKIHCNIALRKVIGDKNHIEANLKSLEDLGFINYYERREFGFFGNKHLIGKQLLLQRWQEAIDLILEEWLISKRPSTHALACYEYISSRDIYAALDMLPEWNRSLLARILLHIKIHGDNLVGALDKVPLKQRLSYVHAYQYFIWNRIISKRFEKFGAQVITGDLVYAQGPRHDQREVIVIDENNIHKYTIYDVVLPLPRHDTIYPANEVAGWYNDLFQADGLSEKDFNLNSKTYGLNGIYRHMMSKPSDLKWKFLNYDDPDQSLITSDLNRLTKIASPPVDLPGGAYLGLELKFSLPEFSFASMALREILKMDIKEFNQATGTQNADKKEKIRGNELCPSQAHPSPLASKGNFKNKPQIREGQGNAITEQPLSEINSSVLDSPVSEISELSRGSPPRKINLEFGAKKKKRPINSQAEQPTNHKCPSSTRKPLEEPQLKKKQCDNKQPSAIVKNSSEEIQKNRSTYQMPQLTVNECLKEPPKICKEEHGTCRTRKSTFIESCEEPVKKKIKAESDTQQEELKIIHSAKKSKFKSIIYIDLMSDEDD